MPNALSQQTTRTSWTLFQGLFIVAGLVAVLATFLAITGATPDNPTAGATPWLLGINFVLIAVLAVVVVREYRTLQRAGGGEGGGRLAKRFVLLFGFSSIIPTVIVAILLGAVITRGLDSWIGERVDTIMEKSTSVSREYLDNFQESLDVDMRLAALDIESFSREVDATLAGVDDPANGLEPRTFSQDAAQAFNEGLRSTLAFRDFLTIAVLGPDGTEIIAEQSRQEPIFLRPDPTAFRDADMGEAASTLYETSGYATVLLKISEPIDGYLYGVKGFDQNQAIALRAVEAAQLDYNAAKLRSGRLQQIFAIGYAQIAVLILLLSGRLGLEAATRVTGPIGRLAEAAHTVRDGDLTVRVHPPQAQDEVYALTHSFNAMTEQLSEQRGALIQAREDAEDRRQFVETLLAEVSAGIIRTDGDLNVTLANRSASFLLGYDDIPPGMSLQALAPEFAHVAQDTLERGAPVDASLDLERDGLMRHIRLKTAPDPANGCVLTFDDTTRLVNAQRQLAWRDVARRIAHEIRNPLTPIMLSTERLRKRYADKIDDTDGVFEKCIETILRQVGDIGRMVEEFSSFARMPKPTVAPFDMVGLLRAAGFSQSMVSPDVDISTTIESQTKLYTGDERLLAQAIGNLVKNAAEAIEGLPEGLDVDGQITLSLDEFSDGFEITIEDNGPGFPEDVRDKLLEPYVTTRERGTGLGLAIVNRIIMDHGGSISLQNRPDGLRGARVRVRLPFAPVAAPHEVELSPSETDQIPTPVDVV